MQLAMAGETDPDQEDEVEHDLKMHIEDEKARYNDLWSTIGDFKKWYIIVIHLFYV